jgi:hypothetical protein
MIGIVIPLHGRSTAKGLSLTAVDERLETLSVVPAATVLTGAHSVGRPGKV